jgi:hypothetical protein
LARSDDLLDGFSPVCAIARDRMGKTRSSIPLVDLLTSIVFYDDPERSSRVLAALPYKVSLFSLLLRVIAKSPADVENCRGDHRAE